MFVFLYSSNGCGGYNPTRIEAGDVISVLPDDQHVMFTRSGATADQDGTVTCTRADVLYGSAFEDGDKDKQCFVGAPITSHAELSKLVVMSELEIPGYLTSVNFMFKDRIAIAFVNA